MLWSEKYAPQTPGDVVGHSQAIGALREWVNDWLKGKRRKPLLLSGATGVGKTAIALALAREYDLDLLEMNASDVRNTRQVERIAGAASVAASLSGKPRLILMDEIDGLFGTSDRGGPAAVAKILRANTCPVLLTANNIWSPKLSGIRGLCERIELKRVNYLSIANFLQSIAEKEKVRVQKETLQSIARNCGGDIRSAINDFQSLAEGETEISDDSIRMLSNRDRGENLFNVVRVVLKTVDFQTSREAMMSTDEDLDFVLKWLDENVAREYKGEDLYNAYERISRADIFLGRRRRRQYYGLNRYASILMGPGVSLAKKEKYHGFIRYGFPTLISMLSRSKPERETRRSIARKVGRQCHVSSSTAIQDYLPMLTELIKKEAPELTVQFDLNEKELEFLGVKKPQPVLKEAEKIKEEHIKQKL